MKMKTIIMAVICLLSLYSEKIAVSSPKAIPLVMETTEKPHGSEIIYLQGSLVLNAGPNAIEAEVGDDAIYIKFNQNFGYVSVTIYNPYGLSIYSGMVNTAVQQLLVIPVSLNDEGIYTIVLENATGYADGDFEIQP